jgi:Ulp1 family protease
MTTLLLCPINTGDHWEIAFAFPQSKKIVYINPLGEQHSKIAKFIRGWRCLIYKRSMEGGMLTFTTKVILTPILRINAHKKIGFWKIKKP